MVIREGMTKSLYTVTIDTPLLKAQEILQEHDIRHLLLDREKLVGRLSSPAWRGQCRNFAYAHKRSLGYGEEIA